MDPVNQSREKRFSVRVKYTFGVRGQSSAAYLVAGNKFAGAWKFPSAMQCDPQSIQQDSEFQDSESLLSKLAR